MKLTNNLSKVELKKSKDAVTGKMGLSWLMHAMKDFGMEKLIRDEYIKGSNRESEYFKKIMTGVMTLSPTPHTTSYHLYVQKWPIVIIYVKPQLCVKTAIF